MQEPGGKSFSAISFPFHFVSHRPQPALVFLLAEETLVLNLDDDNGSGWGRPRIGKGENTRQWNSDYHLQMQIQKHFDLPKMKSQTRVYNSETLRKMGFAGVKATMT
ncbi:Uncharacterized protein TCM_010674 [Theobroma cacao]|uniref:Uncharacterized protein n=1 Tax=Theobroma cacao TaxID=3641 RepID=A0A061E6Y3_THECC|nr:Uncharacterized protein TCM_010674 [Theobroma cacao]